MKVLIYENELKDNSHKYLDELKLVLKKYKVEYEIVFGDEKIKKDNYRVIFVIGGDGTILRRTEFANNFNIPIIGINLGKLGFLSEFECTEIEDAVKLLTNNELVEDKRQTLKIYIDNKEYLALNDIVIQRIYNDKESSILHINNYINNFNTDSIIGDGVIISTPTGSTAYSLSVGGAILTPGINAFIISPIAAHYSNFKPIVISSDSIFKAELTYGISAGLFVDGKFIRQLKIGDIIRVEKSENQTIFLRRKNYNYFKLLSEKLKERGIENAKKN